MNGRYRDDTLIDSEYQYHVLGLLIFETTPEIACRRIRDKITLFTGIISIDVKLLLYYKLLYVHNVERHVRST